MVIIDKDNKKRVILAEIKPEKECPGWRGKSKSGRQVVLSEETKRRQAINAHKFSAARHYCKVRNYEFMVLSEKNLFGISKPKPRSKK